MKKIGLIGGIGPESTVDYYRRLIWLYQNEVDAAGYPELLLYSIDMTAMLKKVADRDWDGLTAMLSDAVETLCRAGAELGFLASNTPHMVFDRVREVSRIPLVSIVESAAEAASSLGLRKVGLLGTLFTMRSSYYQTEFEKHGIAVAVPDASEQAYIQEKLFSEIEQGMFLDETRAGLLEIISRLKRDEAAEGIVLGCTELPLILTESAFGIPFLNTTELHVRAVFDRCKALGFYNRSSSPSGVTE